MEQLWFDSADGVHRCAGYLWQPQGEIRGVVQIVHGIAEHLGRYDHFARYLNAHGYVVCGEDHLGHGKTGEAAGQFGFFGRRNGWTLATANVRAFRQLMGEKFPGVPYILLGHSMGSFLTRTYLCRCPGTVDGAILSGTGQENPLLVAGGKLVASLIGHLRGFDTVSALVHDLALGAYNRQFRPNRTTADWISRDEQIVDVYSADPKCTFVFTVSAFHELFSTLKQVSSLQWAQKIRRDLPVWLFSGDMDPVGDYGRGVKKVAEMLRQSGVKDVRLTLYPGGRHEMLNETNRRQVYQDLLAWAEKCLERKE